VSLRVVRGDADAVELAALVAVLASRAAEAPTDSTRPRSRWASPSRQVRPPLRPGPNGWRASALPR
jgi:hypothetical protein